MKEPIFEALREALLDDRLATLATVVEGEGVGRQLLVLADGGLRGSLGSPELDRQVAALAGEQRVDFSARRRTVLDDGREVELFVEVYPPRPKLVAVGAVHVAIHLARFAKALGFETVVIDPRTAFATAERFADADRLIADWPQAALEELELDENSFVAVLSHDLKIDLPALRVALARPVRYVGALGSKKTHAKRVRALKEEGFSDEQIARIRAPIGLDLGGRRAEEIALAVVAEMVAAGHGRLPGPG